MISMSTEDSGWSSWTNPYFFIQSTGNVGIGTTKPKALLQVGSVDSDSDGAIVIAKRSGPANRKFKIGLDSGYSLSMGDFEHASNDTYSPYLTIKYADGNVGIGITSPGAKLDVNGEINYVTDTTVRRVHNDINSNVKVVPTGGLLLFGTSWANIDTTYYKADLPSAGNYLIYASLRAYHAGDGVGLGHVMLYNNTDSADVANSTRMLIEFQPGTTMGIVNMMCSSLWKVTVNGPKTIFLRGKATAVNRVGIQCDANGYDEFGYIRLN
jgi:hypothetical protein